MVIGKEFFEVCIIIIVVLVDVSEMVCLGGQLFPLGGASILLPIFHLL